MIGSEKISNNSDQFSENENVWNHIGSMGLCFISENSPILIAADTLDVYGCFCECCLQDQDLS